MEFFNVHTHQLSGSEKVLELVNQFPLEFNKGLLCYSIGIHPWYINEDQLEEELVFMEKKLKDPYCLALGECGLDKRIKVPFDLQLRLFERQLLLAQQYEKPVIIHCVAAFGELISIRKRLNIRVPLIVHGYSKNSQLAKALVDNGFYLSFGSHLILKPQLKVGFQEIPSDRFFLETDMGSFGIEEIYAIAAKYKNWSIEELKQQIKSNFASVFKKSSQVEES